MFAALEIGAFVALIIQSLFFRNVTVPVSSNANIVLADDVQRIVERTLLAQQKSLSENLNQESKNKRNHFNSNFDRHFIRHIRRPQRPTIGVKDHLHVDILCQSPTSISKQQREFGNDARNKSGNRDVGLSFF